MNNSIRRIIVLLSVGLGVAATSMSTAQAAQSFAPGQVACGNTRICIYPDIGYRGNPWTWTNGSIVGFVGNAANDKGSSIVNNSNHTVRFYKDSVWGEPHVCMHPHSRISDLRSYSMNDSISSFSSSDRACAP